MLQDSSLRYCPTRGVCQSEVSRQMVHPLCTGSSANCAQNGGVESASLSSQGDLMTAQPQPCSVIGVLCTGRQYVQRNKQSYYLADCKESFACIFIFCSSELRFTRGNRRPSIPSVFTR